MNVFQEEIVRNIKLKKNQRNKKVSWTENGSCGISSHCLDYGNCVLG